MPTTVVIPTRNEGEYLKRTVDGVLNNSPPDTQVIVLADPCEDNSMDFVKTEPYNSRVKAYQTKVREGAILARQNGYLWSHANNDVVFLDSHVIVEPGWLEPLISTTRTHRHVGIVSGELRVLDQPDNDVVSAGETFSAKLINGIYLSPPKPETEYEVPLTSGCFMYCTRQMLDHLGGFDVGLRIWGMEDVELCLRCREMGYDIWINRNSKARHLWLGAVCHSQAEEFYYNVFRTVFMHFDDDTLDKIVYTQAEMMDKQIASKLIRELKLDKRFIVRAQKHRAERKYTADDIIARFNIQL